MHPKSAYKDETEYFAALRDYFAGQCIAAFANEHHGNDWGTSGVEHGPRVARKAYSIADAMLTERSKSTGETASGT